jgi:hypothetical protein
MIVCRSTPEIDKLRHVNQLVARILAELRQMAVPGATTKEIDTVAEERVRAVGAQPAFKGYHGYPATICSSINEQVVHGIPSSRRLADGGAGTGPGFDQAPAAPATFLTRRSVRPRGPSITRGRGRSTRGSS